ncbi:MAG: UDP-N-acetylmuramate dehydrogenase [Saprospiraceae bacterium]
MSDNRATSPVLSPDTVHQDVSLRSLNTFGLEAKAARYYRATSVESLKSILSEEQPTLVLGGGSNLLLTKDVPGLVLHVDIRERRVLQEREGCVLLQAGAGEPWHDYVMHTIEQGYGGLENLSLIPGVVGAAPIQNIGAYGVELKDHFSGLKALNRETLEEEFFDEDSCSFGYRDSCFKRTLKGKYIITNVRFTLTVDQHEYRLDYGDIRAFLGEKEQQPSPRSISDAVVAIRRSKLPDPAEIGNSGSFFKNPELSEAAFLKLQERRPDVRFYALPGKRFKVPAAWMIDQAGWKGHRRGAIGVHDKQALVLVNHGEGKGADLWALAQEILADVEAKFGVKLEPEVNVM